MNDMAELVSDPDFARAFQLERFTGGFANEGEYTQGAPQLIDCFGVIQPGASADMLAVLPEGERRKASITFWCATEIRMADGRGIESDVILWLGRWYRVALCKPWQQHGYYHGIAMEFAHD